MSGESDGKEKETEEISGQKESPKKSRMTGIGFGKVTVRELLYGFLVIFLFLLVFIAGQIQAMMTIEYVQSVCPGAKVVSASALGGISIMPGGNFSSNFSNINFSNWTSPT